jgi:hypothetical protein
MARKFVCKIERAEGYIFALENGQRVIRCGVVDGNFEVEYEEVPYCSCAGTMPCQIHPADSIDGGK